MKWHSSIGLKSVYCLKQEVAYYFSWSQKSRQGPILQINWQKNSFSLKFTQGKPETKMTSLCFHMGFKIIYRFT